MSDINLTAHKAETRAKLKQIRASMPEKSRLAYAETIYQHTIALNEVAAAQNIFIYISYGNEVDTHGLLKYFLEQGKTLAVPKILPYKTMIAVPFSGWEDLAPGELGILTPVTDQPYQGKFDVVITPGLGFTDQGYRIGYGRGYYDQWFARHMQPERIALAYEDTILDELPVDDNDMPVNMIVTENRIIKIRAHNK